MENTDKLINWLKESSYHFHKTKAFAKKVRDYKNGDQLDESIKNILANRGQPEQYENNIAKHNNAIIGFKNERAVEIHVLGRQQQDKTSANMLNALLRATFQHSSYEEQSEAMDDELTIEGIAVAELRVTGSKSYDKWGREHKNVETYHIPSSEIFLDPFSKAKDYNKDARYIHRCFWADVEDLQGIGFDEKKLEKLSTYNYLSHSVADDLYTDEVNRKRILLCYTWYREKIGNEDTYKWVFWSENTILAQGKSPYNFKGFPYVVEFLNRDFSGEIKYWGLYRDVMPLQDHINYAKLRLQNMLGSNKTLINRGSLIDEDIESFNEEWSLDNAVVMVEDINGIKDVKQNIQIQQILNIIIDGRNQINELLNANKEIMGTANNRMSAVAQEQRVQTSLVGLSHFIKKADRLQKKVAKRMIDLFCQYYDSERVINIVDEDYANEYITMNQTRLNQNGGYELELAEDGTLTPSEDNKIKVGEYDLIFEIREKSKTSQTERLKQNIELLKILERTNPALVSQVVPFILKDSEAPSARKIQQIIESQKQNPQESLRMEEVRLEMLHKQSQTNLNNAKAKALGDRINLDLKKAWSSNKVALENVKAKQQKNMTDSIRRIM
ncbi:MAG: hypothetical protein CR967_04630 [Proteobacteria bacterium]|nr:MAG: hypothetical protein CR967_04630 [Pseudomonadota bacterium]